MDTEVLKGVDALVCVPSYSGKIELRASFALAEASVKITQIGGSITLTGYIGSALIDKVRDMLAQDFLQGDWTHLFFLDDDLIFDSDSILRVLSWANLGHDVIAGIYRQKTDNVCYTANVECDQNNNAVFSPNGLLLKMERVATGFMCIGRHVFEGIKKKVPLETYPDKSGNKVTHFFQTGVYQGEYVGEDFFFCDRAREAGFSVWADHNISLTHVGRKEYEGNFSRDVLRPLVTVGEVKVA